MIEATLVFPLLSAVFAVLGIPLWVAMVGPNRLYGVRNAATLGDEAVWYAVNRATGRDLVVVGFLALLLSILLPALGIAGSAYALLMALGLAGGGVVTALIAFARVRRLRL